jgi:hypothetical protein
LGLVVGLVVLFVLAGLVGLLTKGSGGPEVKPDDVVLAASPGAHVPIPRPGSQSEGPACRATSSTGGAMVFYRIRSSVDWTTLKLDLCNPPGYRPGAVSLLFRSAEGVALDAVIPAGGWTPQEHRPGTDAQIGLVLPGGLAWRAWDAALPCRIRTNRLRRYMAPITSFWGDRTDGNYLVGASVQASFDCSGLPLSEAAGAPVDLRAELTVQNCEGTAAVVPAPPLSARCDTP